MDLISLKDALRLIDGVDGGGNAIPNHIVFVTANRKKRTGGNVIELKHAVVNKPRLKKNQLTQYDRQQRQEVVQTDRYRRMREKYGEQIINVQIDLILMINGKGIM